METACLLPGFPVPNNHTETTLITAVFGRCFRHPSSSYILNYPFLFFYFTMTLVVCYLLLLGLWQGICLLQHLLQHLLYSAYSLAYPCWYFPFGFTLLSHWLKQLYSFANKSNTYTRGHPTSFDCGSLHLFQSVAGWSISDDSWTLVHQYMNMAE